MLRKFNSFIEKWMALVTPTCLLLGVCFPDIAKCGLPYVPAVFAFMTFAGALKSRFKEILAIVSSKKFSKDETYASANQTTYKCYNPTENTHFPFKLPLVFGYL